MEIKACIIGGLMLLAVIFTGCQKQVNEESININKQTSISQIIDTSKNTCGHNNIISIRGLDISIDTEVLYLTSAQTKIPELTNVDIKNIEKLKNLKTIVISPDVIDKEQVDAFNKVLNDVEVKVQSEVFTVENWSIVCSLKNVTSISNDFGGSAEIRINNLSGVENLDYLREIYVYEKSEAIDISALGSCMNLETVVVSQEMEGAIDVSALVSCPNLKYISTGFSEMIGYEKLPPSVYLDSININY